MTGDMTWRATCKLNFILLMLSLLLEEEHGFLLCFSFCVCMCACVLTLLTEVSKQFSGVATLLPPWVMGTGLRFTHCLPMLPLSGLWAKFSLGTLVLWTFAQMFMQLCLPPPYLLHTQLIQNTAQSIFLPSWPKPLPSLPLTTEHCPPSWHCTPTAAFPPTCSGAEMMTYNRNPVTSVSCLHS